MIRAFGWLPAVPLAAALAWGLALSASAASAAGEQACLGQLVEG